MVPETESLGDDHIKEAGSNEERTAQAEVVLPEKTAEKASLADDADDRDQEEAAATPLYFDTAVAEVAPFDFSFHSFRDDGSSSTVDAKENQTLEERENNPEDPSSVALINSERSVDESLQKSPEKTDNSPVALSARSSSLPLQQRLTQ